MAKKLIMTFTFLTLITSCCYLDQEQGESVVYMAKIQIGDRKIDSLTYYSTNSGSLIKEGLLDTSRFVPRYMDSSNIIYPTGLTLNYKACEGTPEHWESGPLEVYITHPDFEPYYKVYSQEELMKLPQINFEEAGYNDDGTAWGIWVLPDVILTPKKDK